MIKLIRDRVTWQRIVEGMPSYDFYHTFDYHQIAKKPDEEPLLICYEEGKSAIAIPFLLRSIPGSDYFDLTSVYGYAGPLCSGVDESFNNTSFKEELTASLRDLNIVSLFSRLNPYIPKQKKILQDFGELADWGLVVNIDITKELDEQVKAMSNTTTRYLKKVRKQCYTTTSNRPEDIMLFRDLYYETMNRVSADDFYFFDEEYFLSFMESSDLNTELIFAKLRDSDEIISGAMIIKTNDIVQYHLSGTRTEFLNYTPLRLILDDTRINATYQGYKYFNLGGGYGSLEDSLFFFKSSFSKDFRQFSIWKMILNNDVYEELCARNIELQERLKQENCTYFPLYRYK